MIEPNTNLDVLVVYAGEIANSATSQDRGIDLPFPPDYGADEYNHAYAYFLTECSNQGLTAGFSTSADVTAAGTCDSYWEYTDGEWSKNADSCYAEEIFDKLSPTSQAKIASRDLLLSSSDVRPFNDPDLCETLSDKLLTYRRLPTHSIPTVAITDTSLRGVRRALASLSLLIKNHPHSQDFGPDIFLKNRSGFCGNDIHKVSKDPKAIHQIVAKNKELSHIIQPGVLYDQGFIHEDKPVMADIRLIFQNNQLIQSYIRVAKKGGYLCNAFQGGKSFYLNLKEIPKPVLNAAQQITQDLDKPHSLYSLDFMMSNNGNVFLVEGNTGPGINWSEQNAYDEKMSKELIVNIVEELARRSN